MMKRKQLRAGVILIYLQMGLGIIIGVAYTPYMIRLLGPSEYGLYNTVSSAISMLSLLSLGFIHGYIRYDSQYKSRYDHEGIKKLNGLFFIVFSIIGAAALAYGLLLTFHLDLVFDQGLTASEYEIARVLTLVLTLNLAVSFPMSVFSNTVTSHERFIVLKVLGIYKPLAGLFVTLPLLLAGYRSVAIGTGCAILVINGLVMNIYYYKMCNTDIIRLWKQMLRVSLGLIVPVLCGIVMRNFFNLTSFLQFAGGGYGVYLSVLRFGLADQYQFV